MVYLFLKWLAAPSEGSQEKVSRRHAADCISMCAALERLLTVLLTLVLTDLCR
jgi:hypothetical protein